MILEFFIALSVFFLLLAIFCIFYARKKIKSMEKTRYPDLTAQEILYDLSRGPTLLKIERVSPENIFLRSPRGE